ncbi:hypothetical protein [Daejeonella sp.]|uniref:8-oxoguanine DNA glycosylase n=1 Tax=Daejeonella sp. TaxID=2805397 RepID=UPI0030C18F96
MNTQLNVNFHEETAFFGCIEIDETYIWNQARQILGHFPDEREELMPGLKWGSVYRLYTPAFWKFQYLISSFSDSRETHRLAGNIRDEIVMCMLGGYGIPSEMGIIAFETLKLQKLIRSFVPFDDLLNALSSQMKLQNGRLVKYRFARQKANYIYTFLNRSDIDQIPTENDLEMRAWLMSVNGIGFKTASWITRNWLRSEKVAILDIHLLRAGVITGFFRPNFNLNSEYLYLEERFLTFCQQLEVRPSDMDAIIWHYMKKNNKLALNILSSIT